MESVMVSRKPLFAQIIPALVLLAAGPALATEDQTVRFVPHQVLIRTQVGVDITNETGSATSNNPALADALDAVGAQLVTPVVPASRAGTLISRLYRVDLREAADVIDAVATLARVESVIFAQPNYLRSFFRLPDDISFAQQWGPQKIMCPEAWDLFTGTKDVVLAINDSGVEYTHSDLWANMWVNTDEIPGNGIDDDGNGYIDDVYGADTHDNDGDPTDADLVAHGTHVSGTVGAVANNDKVGQNVVGVMWECQLMAVRIGGWFISTDGIVNGLAYAADNGADVLNMSYGSSFPDPAHEAAIEEAAAAGVVLVAAAGNENTSSKAYPAAYDNVIAVAATDQDDRKASFSNYGDWVDISAPGVDILSTVLDEGYESWDGTSMACPHVVGAAGMVIGYAQTLIPPRNLTPTEVEEILEDSADNIDDLNPGYEGLLGSGRLNVHAALDGMSIGEVELPTHVTALEIALLLQTDDGPQEVKNSIAIDELESVQFKAIGYKANGEDPVDLTTDVDWTVRPLRYGTFDPTVKGQFDAALVPADREVTLTVTYVNERNTLIKATEVITVKDDPNVAPLAIAGPSQVDPGSQTAYTATLMHPDGTTEDVTLTVTWEVLVGTDYVRFDSGRAGVLLVDPTATGQTLTVRATWINEADHTAYQATKEITTTATSRQVAGLFVTGPTRVAAGSTTQMTARLFYTGTNGNAEDVTGTAAWSADSTDSGEFIEPGKFLAAGVTEEKTVNLTAQYTANGLPYAATLQITVIPAVPLGETLVRHESEEHDKDATLDELARRYCSVVGVMLIAGIFLAYSRLD